MIPVGDFLKRRTTPYVNWTLIAINVAVFVYMLTLDQRPDIRVGNLMTSEADRFLLEWGYVPACLTDTLGYDTDVSTAALAQLCPADENRNYLQVFSSMFVHAGWAHIAGNMLFLWVFGDNIEDRLGHLRYLVFYFVCGVAAAALQTGLSPDLDVPAVGASGAIAGVLGGYLILHPTAMVQVIILPLFFFPFFVPAVLLIGFWFVSQLFAGFAELGQAATGSGVAWWAHVGGFIAGAVLLLIVGRRPLAARRAQS